MDKPSSSGLNLDLSKPLPAELRAANNPQERKYGSDGTFKDTVNTGASADWDKGRAAPTLEAETYAKWREETQSKLDRGEDYYADFARRARERSNQSSVTARLVTGLKGKMGKDKSEKDKPGTDRPEAEKSKSKEEMASSVIVDEGNQGGGLFGKFKGKPGEEKAKDNFGATDGLIVEEGKQGGGFFGKFKGKSSDVIR